MRRLTSRWQATHPMAGPTRAPLGSDGDRRKRSGKANLRNSRPASQPAGHWSAIAPRVVLPQARYESETEYLPRGAAQWTPLVFYL
ncbi:hypothetical protein ABIB66_008961 [Bradyrhizobium sp. F1.13.3]